MFSNYILSIVLYHLPFMDDDERVRDVCEAETA
jgi:hypothetical protein